MNKKKVFSVLFLTSCQTQKVQSATYHQGIEQHGPPPDKIIQASSSCSSRLSKLITALTKLQVRLNLEKTID